jgi:uncharacterized protein (TIGR04255 family)
MDHTSPLERLDKPPIVEVVCGVLTDPLIGLDPLVLGTYWVGRRSEYPKHNILPPISRTPGLMVGQGAMPQRTWFITEDDSFVLQFQPDAFYLNWRARGDKYPRFSRDGVLERALRELEHFSSFCDAELGRKPVPRAVELAKIDHFVGGRDFHGKDDLVKMLPCLESPLSVAVSEEPELAMNIQEQQGDQFLQVSLATIRRPDRNGTVLQLETIIRHPVSGFADLRPAFEDANQKANEVFGAWVPKEQRSLRFQEAPS